MVEVRGLSYGRFRDGVVRGEVHDGNAFRRGGVSGHAGLFGTARDVWALARVWLDPARRAWTRDRTAEHAEARGLGVAGPTAAPAPPSPRCPSPASAIRVSPGPPSGSTRSATGSCVLLTNRIHPEVREIPFNEVRQRFHRAAIEAFP